MYYEKENIFLFERKSCRIYLLINFILITKKLNKIKKNSAGIEATEL